MRSAFGFGGQKCSANSRVYVERPVHDELVRLLVEKTEKITIGDPLDRDDWSRPDHRPARRRPHQQAVAEARRDGRVLTGGERLADGDLGPRLLRGAHRRRPARRPPPVPGRALRALHRRRTPWTRSTRRCASRTTASYGLTAGVYSEDPAEVDRFLDEIEAGVLYVNRRAGATTGAWPGVQAFGGWKGSGSTGKSGLVDVLPRPVPARAEPHDRRLTAEPPTGRRDAAPCRARICGMTGAHR